MAHPFETDVRTMVVLSGNLVLSAADIAANTIFDIDPNGARDITLPDASAANAGTMLVFHNGAGGAEVMTIKSTAQATIVTPTQNESAIVFSTGAVWFGIAGADS